MNATLIGTAAALGLIGWAALSTVQSRATTFAAWKVANVAWGDTLNVRKYPSATSQKQAAYPNGTVLQMTGRCTGGIDLLAIAGQPAAKQAALVRREWCQTWHDPQRDGVHVAGWVYGRYIAPR
ncbi:MAG: SH3 domain-containing protein [Rhizobiaceae bacterium]|nr:SH3 domain-containing protein [Rhizobiaceae bacterium]